MRPHLKAARKAAGLTQQQVADKLGIGLRCYKMLEAGTVVGVVSHWDALEDMFGIHQRILRENHPAPEGNQPTRSSGQQYAQGLQGSVDYGRSHSGDTSES